MFKHELREFIKNSKTNIKEREIEIRIHDRFMMNKGVKYDTYKRLLEEFKKDGKAKQKIDVVSRDLYGIRGRERVRGTLYTNKPFEAIIKDKVKVEDYWEYDMRFSEAKESKVNMTIEEFQRDYKIDNVRDKNRCSFEYKNWRVDITKLYSNREFKYEVEIEYIGKENGIEEGGKLIEKIMKIIHRTDYIVTNTYITKLVDDYKSIVGVQKNQFVGPLPYAISKEKFDKGVLTCGYTVTDKADGIRYLLVTNKEYDVFVIGRSMECIYMGKGNYCKRRSVIDGELVKDTFYAFDCLIYGGEDVREKKLTERLEKAGEVINSLKPKASGNVNAKIFKYETKKFYEFKSAEDVWNKRKKLKYELDGLIFTPINKPYYNNEIYKWKPDNTIDFLIRKTEIRNSNDERWILHIAGFDRRNEYGHFGFKGYDGNGNFIVKRGVQHKLNIPIKHQYAIVSKDVSKRYMDNTVIEFKFERNKWVPIQSREDKRFANRILAVNDAWDSIKKPIEIEDFGKQKQIFCGRKFHNRIKEQLIQEYMKKKNVINIGSGAGGNIKKYNRQEVSQVVGVNIVNVEYDHNKRRMRFYKAGNEMYNIKEVIKNNKLKKFDVVNCQFAIHYFFKNEKMLENFVKNIKSVLKKDGLLVATFLDGNKVDTLIGKEKVYENSAFKIEKRYKKLKELTGNEIRVMLKGTKYFNKNSYSKEYAIDIEKFKKYMKDKKFTVIKSKGFENFCDTFKNECELMNKEEKQYSFMNHCLVLKQN